MRTISCSKISNFYDLGPYDLDGGWTLDPCTCQGHTGLDKCMGTSSYIIGNHRMKSQTQPIKKNATNIKQNVQPMSQTSKPQSCLVETGLEAHPPLRGWIDDSPPTAKRSSAPGPFERWPVWTWPIGTDRCQWATWAHAVSRPMGWLPIGSSTLAASYDNHRLKYTQITNMKLITQPSNADRSEQKQKLE